MPPSPSAAALLPQLVGEVDDVEEASAGAVANAGARARGREVGLAGSGAANEDDVALVSQELAAGELAHEVLVDGAAVEVNSASPWPAAA